MTPAQQILIGMAELFEKPGTLTADFLAVDDTGQPTEILSPDATCWCIIGAATKVKHERDLQADDSYLAKEQLGNWLLVHMPETHGMLTLLAKKPQPIVADACRKAAGVSS